MDKNELKKVLKPLIKECIKEVLLEHGVSSLMTESTPVAKQPNYVDHAAQNERARLAKENLERKKKKMLDAIGNDAYNGVDLFEGTTPTTAPSEPGRGPLAGTDPRDAGVDITKLPNFNVWKKLAGN
tara:strand:- start:410 stop:790 length:381 start_codon:yes stop_codon:yes gene_type:complete